MNKKEKIQLILCIIAFIIWFFWFVEECKNIPRYEDMTVEERIRHEQMIFP